MGFDDVDALSANIPTRVPDELTKAKARGRVKKRQRKAFFQRVKILRRLKHRRTKILAKTPKAQRRALTLKWAQMDQERKVSWERSPWWPKGVLDEPIIPVVPPEVVPAPAPAPVPVPTPVPAPVFPAPVPTPVPITLPPEVDVIRPQLPTALPRDVVSIPTPVVDRPGRTPLPVPKKEEPPTVFKQESKKKDFPWVPVLAISGGVVVLGIVAILFLGRKKK
jgi:hypothetical protein